MAADLKSPMSEEIPPRSTDEHRSETPRAEKLRVRWRPEVDFCIPVYCVGTVVEVVLFFGALYSQLQWYQSYHQPVMMSSWCLPITMLLGLVTLSPLDEDALHNDPDYGSTDPQRRASAIGRQLQYAEVLWKACVWINAAASAILAVTYGSVARSAHLGRAAARIPGLYVLYAAAMSCAFGLAAAANASALRRVARLGRRAFAAGLDALTLEAEALLGGGAPEAETSEASEASEAAGPAGEPGGLRRRRAGGAGGRAGGGAGAEGAPLGLAAAAGRQFLQGNLDRQGLEDVLRQLGVDPEAAPALEECVARHERTGGATWPELARALEEAVAGVAEVPPKPVEEPVLTSAEAKPGQA